MIRKTWPIRRATDNDAPAVAQLTVDCWRAAYRGLVPDAFLDGLDRDGWAHRIRASLASGAAETYLAEHDSSLLGFVTLGPCRDEDLDPQAAGEIWGIYVAPQHWRTGVGTLLCREGERILAARGRAQAVLWVLDGNRAARCFYEAMGYTADGASKTLERGAPLEALRYRKQLRAGASGAFANRRCPHGPCRGT